MPSVSVVVPTYKRPEFLAVALRSLVAQTMGDFEALVCDNAAQAETEKVVTELGDDRITYIPREQNLGMVASVFDGLRRCTGDYVMKFDDDDEMHPECLEVLTAPFRERPGLAVSASDFDLVDDEGRPLPDLYAQRIAQTGRDRTPEGYLRPFTAAVARGTVDMVSTLIRRSAIDWTALDERADSAYDLHLLLLAAQDAAEAHYSSRRLVRYRIHGSSDSSTRHTLQTAGAVYARIKALESGRHTDVEALRSTLAGAGVMLARGYLRQGDTAEARDALVRSGALSVDVQAWRLWALSRTPSRIASKVALGRARAAGVL